MNILRIAAQATLISSLMWGLLAQADTTPQTTLRVGTWLPPTNPQNAEVWPTWAKWVEEATEGRVAIQLEYGLGHPKTMFNLVEDGVVDVAFTVVGYQPGRFKLPLVAELPGISDSAEATSVALWRTQQQYFSAAKEFDGLELLGLFVHGPAQIHTREPFSSLQQLKNQKIRIGGGLQMLVAERLDVSPVQAPAPKVYEMMQQGVVDGVFLPVLDQKYLRLSEVTSQITVIPRGLYASSFAIFASPDTLDSLSAADRQAILSVSGERLSALAGRAWEQADRNGYEAARNSGVEIHQLQPGDAMLTDMQQRLSDLPQQWVKDVADRDIDANAALDYLRQQARSYQQPLAQE
ncbi:TRAP transporter substrate-binding protein [Oceanobacter sp. 5_MG-2023]|uniref:TRAP transporter substrate-binding protein n=2 Tax=Gammaproteobacteria TaxID=1236 RepID=UPI0026E16374|nr:TRAP transporter substrate-binding protein [Oceanobacter sp. 5_MG-2023]MDO6683179.1 TRAP transporter substrate-binding protein [Oceanobacter sp. 5_MG-2023]